MPQMEQHRDPNRSVLNNLTEQKHRPPSVTIGLSPPEVFAFVRDFTNYPKFMRGLKDVTVMSETVAHFAFDHEGSVDGCDVEKLSEHANQSVLWKTVGTSSVDHTGAFAIEAAPGRRGTVVTLKMNFEDTRPGKVRGMIRYFLGRDPKSEAYINLRRLKAYLETGEVPTIQGQPSGRDQ